MEKTWWKSCEIFYASQGVDAWRGETSTEKGSSCKVHIVLAGDKSLLKGTHFFLQETTYSAAETTHILVSCECG